MNKFSARIFALPLIAALCAGQFGIASAKDDAESQRQRAAEECVRSKMRSGMQKAEARRSCGQVTMPQPLQGLVVPKRSDT